MGTNPWETLGTEVVYQNPHITFRKDSVQTPAGTPGEYGIVQRPGGVCIVAMDANQAVCMIRQYRYPVQQFTWEVPAGSVEGAESGLQAAQRELAEEAGLRADTWMPLGEFLPASGYSTEALQVFLAQGLHDIQYDGNDPDEYIQTKQFFSLKDIAELMQGDVPFEGPTIAAVSLACVKLGLRLG